MYFDTLKSAYGDKFDFFMDYDNNEITMRVPSEIAKNERDDRFVSAVVKDIKSSGNYLNVKYVIGYEETKLKESGIIVPMKYYDEYDIPNLTQEYQIVWKQIS